MSDFRTTHPIRKRGWSLHLTVEGRGRYNCIRQQLITRPGGLVLIAPHGIYDYKRESRSKTWLHHWMYFRHDEKWRRWLRWPEVGPGIHHVHVKGKSKDQIYSLFLEAARVSRETNRFADELTENILRGILIRVSRLLPEEITRYRDERVVKTIEYIASHFHEEFTVADLARRLDVSAPRLASLFKQQTGMSIMRWRDEQRMHRATQLLADTGLPVSHIAQQVGYHDALYFSRRFREHMGVNPSRYRIQSQ